MTNINGSDSMKDVTTDPEEQCNREEKKETTNKGGCGSTPG
jgi:hypothetical protein